MRNMKKIKLKVALGLFIVVLMILLFSDYIIPNSPTSQNISNALQRPSIQYPFGTDMFGRCLFSRVLVGGKTTVYYCFLLVSSITIFGTMVGVVAGYVGGKIDTLLMSITTIFMSFPQMIVAVALIVILFEGMFSVVLALFISSWGKYARLARSRTLEIKNATYIQAAMIAGDSHCKIICIHFLPNILDIIVVTAVSDIGVLMCELAAFSFLGLGATPPTIEWGMMMNESRSLMQIAPWTLWAPGFAIFFMVILCHYIGDTLRDVWDY